MIIISLALWSGCMATQFFCEKKRVLTENLADKKKYMVLEEEVEKIISAFCKELKGQTEVYVEELSRNNEEIKSFKAKIEECNFKTNTILENIQGAAGSLQDIVNNLKISEIYNVSSDIYEKLEDVKSEISDSRDSIAEKLSDMSEELSANRDNEIEIIDKQSDIVDRYEGLIRRLNDEVVVNIINDSNNMINCLRDCYNLLESIRRARR